jgi:hypothetical protein
VTRVTGDATAIEALEPYLKKWAWSTGRKSEFRQMASFETLRHGWISERWRGHWRSNWN